MPAINSGSSNANQVKVRRPKKKPTVKVRVPRPDAQESTRTTSAAHALKLVPKAGDAPQTRKADTKKAEDFARKKYAAEKKKGVIRSVGGKQVKYVPHTTVLPDTAHSAAFKQGIEAHKAEVAAKVAPVLKVLDQTTRPLHAIAGAADAAITHKNVLHAAKLGIQNKQRKTSSDVFTDLGWKPKSGLGKFAKGAVSFGVDVAADPLTYVTGGTASVASKSAGKAATKGITVKVAGKEVPAVRKATAAAGSGTGKTFRKVVPERVRNATRDAVSEVNPNVAPAGVAKQTHDAARVAARRARAAEGRGHREAINLAHGIKTKIGEKNYATVIDAIEARNTASLPAHLQGHAETLQQHFAHIRQTQKAAGLRAPERKGYVPHKLTAQAIKDENKKAATVGGRTVNISSSKARKEQRTLAELRLAEPGRYREDLHAVAAERMAEGTGAAARATLAKDVAALGHPVTRGTKPHLSEREAVYKLKDGKLTEVDTASKAFQKKPPTAGTKAQYVVLNKRLVQRTLGSAEAPSGSTIVHGYDKAQSGFKRLALATPGFHIRNIIGDTSQAYVHQPGYKLPGNMVRASRVLKAVGRDEKSQRRLATSAKPASGRLKTKHYGHVSYEEAAQKLIDAGAARSGYTARELRELSTSGSKKVRLPKTPAGARRVFLNREDLPRLATAIHALRQGATYEEAAAKVAGAHFDYAELTPFERNVARRILPFYTWTSRNIPLQTKRILTNPGKYAAYQKVREEAANATQPSQTDPKTQALYKQLEAAGVKLPGGYARFLGAYEQRNAGVPISWKGHRFTLSAGLPLQDLGEIPGASGSRQAGEYLNKAASLVTPVVKDPVEFGFNYSFFFRDQVQRDTSPLVAAPSPVGAWPDWAKKKFGVVKAIDKRSGKMVWQWPGKADYVAHAVPGLPSAIVKMLTPGHDRQGKGVGGKALSIAGIKAAPLDPTTNAINLAYARQKEIQTRLAALRQQGVGKTNPSPEWRKLNDQLKLVSRIAYQGKTVRGDAVLPTTGGPPKGRSSGKVQLNGATGSKVHLGGSPSGVRIKLGG